MKKLNKKMKKIDIYLDKVIRIITPLIFLLPFIVWSGFYFPFITPRNFAFRIIVSILFALYTFLFIRNRHHYRPLLSKFTIAYLVLGLVMTISSIFGGDFWYSFWSNYERMEGLLGYYYLSALLIVILGVYNRQKAWLGLLRLSVFASLPLSYIALTQILGLNLLLASAGGDRVSSMMGNPSYLAAYALFHIFFALYLIFKDKREKLKLELIGFYIIDVLLIYFEFNARSIGQIGPLSIIFSNLALLIFFIMVQLVVHLNFFWRRQQSFLLQQSKNIYFALIVFLNFIALFNTQTRGALLGLLLGLLVAGVFMFFVAHKSRKTKIGALVLVALVFAFVSIAFVFKNTSFVQNNKPLLRVASVSLNDTTTETRILTWRLSLKGWSEKPILGWGEERFQVVFNKYFPSEIYKHAGSRVWFDRPHNIFLQYLVNGGLIGFGLYVSMYVFVILSIVKFYRRSHDYKTAAILLAVLVGYGAQNFFVFDSLNTSIIFVLYLAMVSFITQPVKKEWLTHQSKNTWLAWVLPIIILFIGYSINIPQMQANQNFVKQYGVLQNAKYSMAEQQKYFSIVNSHYLGKFEGRQVYSEFASSFAENKENDPLNRKAVVDLAVQELQMSIAEQPDNVRNHAFLVNLYSSASENVDPNYADKNIELINQALPLSPGRTPFYYSLGRAYMIKQDPLKSLEMFEKAKQISPNVFESHINLLAAYLTIANYDKAAEVVNQVKSNSNFYLSQTSILRTDYYARMAEAYFVFGRYKEALAILDEAISIFPEEPRFLVQGIVYGQQGKEATKVKGYLEQLKKADPNLAAQAQAYLDNAPEIK